MEDRPKFFNKEIQCVDCGEWFVFTATNADYFWSKGLSDPKRCEACRKRRKRTLIPDPQVVSDARS